MRDKNRLYAWKSTPSQSQKASVLAAPSAGSLIFEVELTNSGKVDSAKTVQLYIKQLNVVDAPLRQLAGLAKVFVKAGETITVPIDIAEYAGICSFCVIQEDGSSSVPVGTQYVVTIGNGGEEYFAGAAITAV